MKTKPWIALCIVLLGLLMAPASLVMAAEEEEDEFVPVTDAPPASRTGGAARGKDDASAEEAVTASLIAPEAIVGYTTLAQPTFYYYISGDTEADVEVALVEADNTEVTLLYLTVPGKKGMQKLDLSAVKEAGKPVTLKPDVLYELNIQISPEGSAGSQNPFAATKVKRIVSDLVPADAPKQKDKAKLASVYAKAGVWMDYFHALNEAIEQDPKNETLIQKRTSALANQQLIWKPDGTVTELKRVAKP